MKRAWRWRWLWPTQPAAPMTRREALERFGLTFATLSAIAFAIVLPMAYDAQANDPNRPCQYIGIPCENASTR